MLSFRGVQGTCIAQHAMLLDPKKWTTTLEDLAGLLRGKSLVFMETTEEQSSLRDILIELGASSNRVGDNYAHAIDSTAIPDPRMAMYTKSILEGEALNIAEGRKRVREGYELREGDRAIYIGNLTLVPGCLTHMSIYWDGGRGVRINNTDKETVTSWTSRTNGTYSGSYWYVDYFRRIPDTTNREETRSVEGEVRP